ncbi:23S rRNA (pseudouridine(1915)-N(3))-methyltransferase RlmH [Succinispira mobilis]|uniref:23S rRNA (pseudouridine(1915)-N(3))-methyltransferase RlmH n=1 Tax=Succinispira mobilis TaxID=78120 RepID=UPI00035DE209|nr:23S rRNA (pseudouridine(1915)-N(3))-methyltransferase RlmH [Succinispira mobilis]
MKITILAVGKLKEKYLVQGMQEFIKRLKPYCSLEILEVSENALPEKFSTAQLQEHLEIEAQKILKLVPERAYMFLLDLHGQQLSSEALAAQIDGLTNNYSQFVFVIGGAFGVGESLRKRADYRWSFSQLTFTHQMIRLLLIEQVYRAFKISKGEKYHW